jgi:UDP-GlcNAc:undecaprenyl-phosphate GlcNAc-1-phosphate transferase
VDPQALTLALAFATALAVSLAATPVVIRLALGFGLFDQPDARRVHSRPIPRLGGVAVFVATAAGVGVASAMGNPLFPLRHGEHVLVPGILLCAAVLFLSGLVDDVRGLRALEKLVIQGSAAALAYAVGFRIEVLTWGHHGGLELGWLSLPVTILWIVGVTNAFNLIDGLDGLATGVATIALASVLTVAALTGRPEVMLLALILLGALLGFMRYNFNPARIFLGDSGSLFVGFALAIVSVYGSMKSTTAVVAVIPLSVLALPLLDTFLVVARRWLRGIPVTAADKRHIHHQLLAAGLTTRAAVLVLYLIALCIAVAGVVLAFSPPTLPVIVSILAGGACLVLLLTGLSSLQYHELAVLRRLVLEGPTRLRRVVRDRINAEDAAKLLQEARSLEEVNAVLRDSVRHFQFEHLELCSPMDPPVLETGAALRGASVWHFDFPVALHPAASSPTYVLRIWFRPEVNFRYLGGEQVAAILGPAVERWLEWPVEGRSPGHAPAARTNAGLAARTRIGSAEALGLAWDGPAPHFSVVLEQHQAVPANEVRP